MDNLENILRGLPWSEVIAFTITTIFAILGWSGKMKWKAILRAVIIGVDRGSNLIYPTADGHVDHKIVKKAIMSEAEAMGVNSELHKLVQQTTKPYRKEGAK